jgi:hypothetical protein
MSSSVFRPDDPAFEALLNAHPELADLETRYADAAN